MTAGQKFNDAATRKLDKELSKGSFVGGYGKKPDLKKVRQFIKNGADVNVRETFTGTLLSGAARRETGTGTLLGVAARRHSASIVKALIDGGAEIDATNNASRHTALHAAIEDNRVENAQILIDAGANIDLTDIGGMTPLMLAALLDRAEIASALIKKGARLDTKYLEEGKTFTAYDLAVEYDAKETAALLKKAQKKKSPVLKSR